MITVICDIDDVLWELVDAWIDYYNKYNKDRDTLSKDDVTDWDIVKCTKPKNTKFFWEILNLESFYDFIYKYIKPHTYDTLKRLNDCPNVKLYFATSTYYTNATVKIQYFLHFFNFIASKQVITIHDKYLLNGDIFIEDSPVNLKRVIEIGGKCYCVNKPWNTNIKENKNCCKEDEFKTIVDKITSGRWKYDFQ